MLSFTHRFVAVVNGLAAALTLHSVANAQDAPPPVPVSSPPPSLQQPMPLEPTAVTPPSTVVTTSNEALADATVTKQYYPNRPLLITGGLILGASYGGSAIVAALSDREADDKLYYPVVGPWLDLNRRGCSENPCENDTRDRALLVGAGVLQGIGAAGVLLSFIIPETTTESWFLIGNEDFVVSPELGRVAGVRAAGRF